VASDDYLAARLRNLAHVHQHVVPCLRSTLAAGPSAKMSPAGLTKGMSFRCTRKGIVRFERVAGGSRTVYINEA
jgi:hypothetical protein